MSHLKRILILSLESSYRKKELNTLLNQLIDKLEMKEKEKKENELTLAQLKREYKLILQEIEVNQKKVFKMTE